MPPPPEGVKDFAKKNPKLCPSRIHLLKTKSFRQEIIGASSLEGRPFPMPSAGPARLDAPCCWHREPNRRADGRPIPAPMSSMFVSSSPGGASLAHFRPGGVQGPQWPGPSPGIFVQTSHTPAILSVLAGCSSRPARAFLVPPPLGAGLGLIRPYDCCSMLAPKSLDS